jgi:hypothetical protein
MLLKEYIHTGEAYRGQFGADHIKIENMLSAFYNPFTNELRRISFDEEFFEPARYEEFKELTQEEYQKCIENVRLEVEIRNFTLYAQKYPGRIFRNPPKKQ